MLTIMIVPHSTSKPIRFDVSKEFILILFLLFLSILGWTGFIIHKQMDYFLIKAKNIQLLKENDYFAKEVVQARQKADEIKDLEGNLKKLLGFENKKAIIYSGGPSMSELERITKYLDEKELCFTPQEFSQHTRALESETTALKKNFAAINLFIENEKSRWAAVPCCWPCYGRITSGFGYRIHPLKGIREMHRGIDIANKKGTHIKATANGRVALAGWQPGYGRLVVIKHAWGYMTRYGHCSKILVKRGQRVVRGQIIALLGASGGATGPHLHYEVWKNRRARNPKKYLSIAILK